MLKLPEEFKPLRAHFEASGLDYAKIITQPSEVLTLTQSKLGGNPSLPSGFEYPFSSC